MTPEKQKCINEIQRAFEHARELGYRIVVSSDEEGNNWNSIEPSRMVYGGTQDNFIAIGVYENVDEDDIFIAEI